VIRRLLARNSTKSSMKQSIRTKNDNLYLMAVYAYSLKFKAKVTVEHYPQTVGSSHENVYLLNIPCDASKRGHWREIACAALPEDSFINMKWMS
jgi:hypothetical protein